MSKKQPARKILPTLPSDWWDRTVDDLKLDAPGKMILNHIVHDNGFEVQLSIVQSLPTEDGGHMVTFHAMGRTMRYGIRKVEEDAIAAGFVQRRRK